MENASEILLIIVSSVLAIFLIMLIVVIVYLLSVLRHVKRILQRAENVAINVEAAAEAFERSASPIAAIKVISNIIKQAAKSKKGKG